LCTAHIQLFSDFPTQSILASSGALRSRMRSITIAPRSFFDMVAEAMKL
jgi:hypothetical protein